MIELLLGALFCVLMFKTLKLAFKLTWGAVSVIGSIIAVIAVPIFILCMIFAGGVLLFLPVLLIGIAYFILKQFS